MEKVLKLYKYIDGVNDTPFPSEGKQVVTSSFRYDIKRMGGAPTISCTIMHELCLDKLWSDNVYASFNGEKFFIKQTPSSSYDNSDSRYKHEVELVSERIVLDNVYFYDVVYSDASYDKPVSNSSRFTFFGDVREFAGRLNQSLKYSKLGYSVVVDSEISSEAKQVSFEDQFFSNVLQEIYNTYNLPYYFSEKVIHIGYTSNDITQTFKYGQDESLLSINKQNANFKIVNRVTGVGSSDNIPYYYPNDYESKSEVEANGGTWINPQTNLMPPIYRKSLGDERFYSAKNNTYIDPISGLYYEFSNPYIEGKPKEHIINFEDIKPTIKEATNASGDRIDMFLEFAYDLNDNDETDEAGNYLHPYFFAKLKRFDGQFGFNLFEHSIDEQEMTISMTSGSCASCEWIIVVDEETQRNTVQVDDSGNLVRDKEGNVKFGSAQDRQNDTGNHEVWIALKKDVDTFGIIMPNASNNYKPNAGDSFVILHIDLPKAYILDAEKRLEDSLVKYMAMNNDEKFNFSISFSRIYFAEHPDILEQLNENARLQIEYDNERYELYVSSYSYALNSGSPLPEVKVELSDTLTINQNALQNAIDAVKQDILSSFGGGDFLKQGLKYFLRKDVNDRSRGFVASDKGFEVGRYKEGELGSGGIFKLDKDKNSYLEVDKMLVRKIAYFVEIMIKKLSHVGGSIILSPASMKCSKVEEHETYYRCYFENEHEGKTIYQEFVVGDQARSQEFNIKEGLSQNVSNQYYWRLVVGVGSNYIDLSKADCDSGSGVPLAGDDIVQLGNRDNPSRQRAIILSSYGEGTPSIIMYRGIKSYSMSDAKMPLRLSPDGNIIEGDFISKSGKNLEEWMSEVEVNWDKVLEQTDKEFTMWFFEYDPSPEVYPESEWFTDELRALHEQDLFYNTAKGMAWRYTLKDGVFFWELVTDADTLKALEDAARAQQTADGAVQRLDSIVSDGKLSAVEKKEVRKEWASIVDTYEWNMYSSERIGVDMDSSEVVAYSNAYNALSAYITPLLAEDGDSDINPDEYRGYWTDYYTTETKLRNFLSEKAKEKADDVEQQVNEISSDGVLSALEKKEVLKEWMSIVEEYRSNTETAQNFGMTTEDPALNEYVNAYNALGSYMDGDEDGLDEDKWDGVRLPSWLADLSTNQTIVGDVYRSRWTAYYDTERVLLSRISVIAKDKADDAQEDADKANDELGKIASDNVLSKVEKKETLREWMEEFDAYYANLDNAEKYSVDTADYEGKFYALAYYLNGNEAWDGYSIPLWLRDLTVNQEITGSVFRQKWADYYNAKVSLLDAISTAIKAKADEAQQGVDDVNDRVDDIVSDGVLSSLEKKEVLKEWDSIASSYAINIENANKYNVSHDDYTASYVALGTYLNNGDVWDGISTPIWLNEYIGVNTIINPSEYRQVWVDYYDSEKVLLDSIYEYIKGIADSRIRNFVDQPIPPYDEGDRWCNATYGDLFDDDDLVCVTSKEKGEEFSIEDWRPVSYGKTSIIKNMEGEIKLLADSFELGADGKYYLSKEAGVNITTEMASLYATKTEYNTLARKVSSNSSQINATANSLSAFTEKISFNINGDITNISKSGLVTTSNYASIFSQYKSQTGAVVQSEISAFVTKDADGTLSSNVKITADNVDINGIVKVSGTNTVKIGGWTVEENKLYAETGLSFVGTIDDYSISIEPSGMKVSYGDDFITAEFGANYASISDWGGLSALNIVNHKSVGAVGYTKMCALRVKGDPNDMGIIVEGAACAFRPSSGAITSIHGLAVNARSNSGSIQSNDDFIKVDRNTTLPSPVTLRGKILFVKCSGSYTLTVPSCVLDDESSSGSGSFKDNHMRAFISNGTYWFEMNLTDTW